jgi:hypothetical protein
MGPACDMIILMNVTTMTLLHNPFIAHGALNPQMYHERTRHPVPG